jgi:hypothetical protein
MDNLILPDDIEFGTIQFTKFTPPSDHPYYEYMRCEWEGDSPYLLLYYDYIEDIIRNDYLITEYPIGGIVDGIVFFIGQYHVQIIGYSEAHGAYILERLN